MSTEYLLTFPPRSDSSPTQLHKCPRCERFTTAVGKVADTLCGICLAKCATQGAVCYGVGRESGH
jgi:hypothetical protein